MKKFTIEISDNAAGALDEMRRFHRVQPENVIRIMVECGLADALDDRSLHATYVISARRPDQTAAKAWQDAVDTAAESVKHLGT